ncbi:MAG: LysR family transcriptional regulator [Pseudomonadota bacterium]
MSEVNLSKIDLNLLVALEVLLEERHVSKSAARLGLSQPAMSRTLGRLRAVFDDPLIVRTQSGYEPTARAEKLENSLKAVLGEIRGVFASAEFDPATAEDTFRLSTLDYSELVIFPEFMSRLRKAAPGVKVDVQQRSIFSINDIEAGTTDMSIGVMPKNLPKHCRAEKLFEDDYVCVMHADHPLASRALTLEGYLAFPHSTIDTGKSAGSAVDDALARVGAERRVLKRSPHFIASLFSLGKSDLLQTVPRRLASPLLAPANLVLNELPFEVDPIALSQLWHARDHDHPPHRWLREQMRLAAQSV